MQTRSLWLRFVVAFAALLFPSTLLIAQTTTASLNGTVVDQAGAVVSNVTVTVINNATAAKREVRTDSKGDFSVALLPPGQYSLRAVRTGFARIEIPNITLNTNDQRTMLVRLKVGAVNETVTVDASTAGFESSSSVGTVVDNNFVNELPLKSRSFQSLLLITPGVVLAGNGAEAGQLSINGMRSDQNYWTIDGLSVNTGVAAGGTNMNNMNQTFTGSVPGFNAFGTTNGLISVDALQEFKVQTSTYSAEFGRQPGGQVQMTTRSGSNQFHGVMYDYLRNDIFDAMAYFDNWYGNPEPVTRYNDYGATLGGPILKNHTFFFFSYEGMKYRHPLAGSNVHVPTAAVRNDSRLDPNIKALLNAFPVGTGPEEVDTTGAPQGTQLFYNSKSTPMNSDSYSLRLDHNLSSKWSVNGRYTYAPSFQQSWNYAALQSTQTNQSSLAFGVTGTLTPALTNQISAGYSRSGGVNRTAFESIYGATPPPAAALFGGRTPLNGAKTTYASWSFYPTGSYTYAYNFSAGDQTHNLNRALNITDTLSWAKGSHLFKFGVDYRHLSPVIAPVDYSLNAQMTGSAYFYNNTASYLSVSAQHAATIISNNYSAFAQDTWKMTPRLTLDYGIRWEVNPAPSGGDPNDLIFVQGWENPSTMTIAPQGTKGYTIDWAAFAPRAGASYELRTKQGWESIIRGGFGLFYDLGSAVAAASATGSRSQTYNPSITSMKVPFNDTILTPLPVRTFPTPPYTSPLGYSFFGKLDNWSTPKTYEWNVALQQSLGSAQTLTITYVGDAGRKMPRRFSSIVNADGSNVNFPTSAQITIVRNDGNWADTSIYHGLQVSFQRQMKHGVQLMSNYTWAHAIDTASQDTQIFAYLMQSQLPVGTRGNSDSDRRHNLNVAMTYQVPNWNPEPMPLRILNNVFTKGWSVSNVFSAQSGTPFNVLYSELTTAYDPNGSTNLRPDLIPNVPLWISQKTYTASNGKVWNVPGGKRLNPAAFNFGSYDPVTGVGVSGPSSTALGPVSQLAQGNLPRNFLRTSPAWQLDTSLGRDFKVRERLKLQYRFEAYNIMNHANLTSYSTGMGFYNPNTKYNNGTAGGAKALFPTPAVYWGMAQAQMGMSGSGGMAGMMPVFSTGGSRSVQMALKLVY
jgi:hypothetical protein